ncbi:MAG: hypothetical protein AAGJ35_15405, partial [Myxococcota bacterium]
IYTLTKAELKLMYGAIQGTRPTRTNLPSLTRLPTSTAVLHIPLNIDTLRTTPSECWRFTIGRTSPLQTSFARCTAMPTRTAVLSITHWVYTATFTQRLR